MAILHQQICPDLKIVFTIPNEIISLGDLIATKTTAQIYSDMDAIFIEDSTSQVLVNDNKIFIHQLKEGDVIRVDDMQLVFSENKIVFPPLYYNKWHCVREVWSKSDSVSVGGRGAGGEIALDSLFLSCVFENERDFPDKCLYEGLLHESIVVASYSLLVLLYRNSKLLKNTQWKNLHTGKVRYYYGCVVSSYTWNEFVQLGKQKIIPGLDAYRGYLQRCSIPEHSKMLQRFLKDWQYKNTDMWRNSERNYVVLLEDDCDHASPKYGKYGNSFEGMRYSAELFLTLRNVFGNNIDMNPFFMKI
ncbi:FHA domain-containing protein [Candidatus Uabimicrobium amorphum]|uniref:FHA domain-containing protein n=1 Tax=Uabimicrobium amorphum TaxID=2596890 RepID=A0A5S9IP45_UABAM|nr:FHA domain-containing protein [Candidatus Uabimicrobium amorphum]BBM84600.1 hypothetical protein UABAM_02961 [Candidatus Uabimicrobium amorphum]